MSAQEVAEQFVKFYYQTFDTNRPGLASLYQEGSSLSWEGELCTGVAKIVDKLSKLPNVQHQTNVMDIQPSTSNSAMLIFVQGKLVIEGNQPLQFTQIFQLVANAPGSYYIHNDIFRLQYG